jgi:hypothetical protein
MSIICAVDAAAGEGKRKEGTNYFTPTGENQFMAFNAWFDYDPIKKLMAWGTLYFARGVRG